MAKRVIDILISAFGLALTSPLIVGAMLCIWLQDRQPVLYRAVRVGRDGVDFRMFKVRSMILDAQSRGGVSTPRSDDRITPVGKVVRRWKIDELPQFWNVLRGDMSLVGPRPNVRQGGVETYTAEEMRLLTVRPGITDLASIVFSDEADILDGAADPQARYETMIRPWKSKLGLAYIDHRSLIVDGQILCLTAIAILFRAAALRGVGAILDRWPVGDDLRETCRRRAPLPRAGLGASSV